MENDRLGYNSVVSPRALREIYLLPFMLAQKYAKPWCYMTAYVLAYVFVAHVHSLDIFYQI